MHLRLSAENTLRLAAENVLRLAASLLAGAALCLAAPAGAEPFVMYLGPDRLVLDTPPGFSDTAVFSSPRLAEIAEMHSAASNRVLVFGIADADARRFSVGDPLELRRYMLAGTPHATERTRISAADFAALMQEVIRELGALPPASQPPVDFMQYLQSRTPGQPSLLAELRREPRMVSVLQGIMLPRPEGREKEKPIFRLSTASIILAGGKPLYLSVFTAYEGPADLAWIRGVTERWIDDLQRLNR